MRILSTVIRGHLLCVGRDHVNTCKLLDTKPVSKLKYQVYTRGQATASVHGFVSIQKQLPLALIFQQRRSLLSDTPGKLSNIHSTFIRLYTKDSVPKGYELIYLSQMGAKMTKLFAMLGIVVFSYFFFFIYLLLLLNDEWEFIDKTTVPVVEVDVPTLALQLGSSMAVCLVFLTFVQLNIAKLPVKRIYESPCKKKYIGIFKKDAFRTEKVEFEISDVIGTGATQLKLMRKGNVNIKGRSCLIYATDFKVPKYFHEFTGVDASVPEEKKDSKSL